MNYRSYDDNGVLRVWHDDVTRTVYVYGEDGVQTSSQPYTAAQNAEADYWAAIEASRVAREAARAIVKLIVTDLQAEKARVQPIIDKDNALLKVGDIKDVARAAKRIADAAIELSKFVQDI